MGDFRINALKDIIINIEFTCEITTESNFQTISNSYKNLIIAFSIPYLCILNRKPNCYIVGYKISPWMGKGSSNILYSCFGYKVHFYTCTPSVKCINVKYLWMHCFGKQNWQWRCASSDPHSKKIEQWSRSAPYTLMSSPGILLLTRIKQPTLTFHSFLRDRKTISLRAQKKKNLKRQLPQIIRYVRKSKDYNQLSISGLSRK